jgi:hypothetical protein
MTTRLLALASLLLLVTACGDDDKPTAPSSEASTTDARTTGSTAGDPTGGGPAFTVDTADQTAGNSGKWDLVLIDVRVAEHEGFDRIVLEFTGTGVPGWAVNYVDEAVLDGSGVAVTLGGDVKDMYVGGTFEGYTQVLAGIEGHPVPFRVFTLTGPPRLVVDVDDTAG